MALQIRIRVSGCKPNVINYLKAIGLLKAIYLQFDSEVKGFFQNDDFFIETTLDRDELTRVFEEKYQPTPILSPFTLGRDSPIFEELERSQNPRLNRVKSAYQSVKGKLSKSGPQFPSINWLKEIEAQLEELHPTLIIPYKAFALGFYELSQALKGSTTSHFFANFQKAFENLRIEENYLAALSLLIDFDSASSQKDTRSLFFDSIFAENKGQPKTMRFYSHGNLFSSSKDQNLTLRANPWDYVFAVNGFVALCKDYPFFSKITVPFCLKATSYDWNLVEENPFRKVSQRTLWLPLWHEPLGYVEVSKLLLKLALSLNDAGILSGLDLASEGAILGIDPLPWRFLRVGLNFDVQKSILPEVIDHGLISLTKIHAPEIINPIRDWIFSWKEYLNDGPKSYRQKLSLKDVEDSLLVYHTGAEKSFVPTLINLGICHNRALLLPKNERPDPLVLPHEILKLTEEDTPEFRIALAIASLDFEYPVRGCFEPVFKTDDELIWNDSREILYGDIVNKLCQLLEARVKYAKVHNLKLAPLTSYHPARQSDVELYLKGKLDDEYLESLINGLILINFPKPGASLQPQPKDPDILNCYLLLRTAFCNSHDFDALSRLVKTLRFSSLTESLILTKELAKNTDYPLTLNFQPSLNLNKRLLSAIIIHCLE